MTYSGLKKKARKILDPLITLFAKLHIHPSALTITGFVVSCFSAYLFAFDLIRWAGITLIVASLFDAIDGAVARRNNQVSDFGAFLDSTMDRFSEFAIFLGIFIHYIRIEHWFLVFVTLFSLFGSGMVSYTRARAEGLGVRCAVGFFDRTMRITFIVVGALLGRFIFGYFLLLLAAFTQFTVIQRVIHVRKELRQNERRNNA
jgi:CDP-diacylglycerol--glycerol-3-phosphate 3-phosphatidyltransferase